MIIADTHVIIWDALQPEKISRNAAEAIHHANETDGIVVCDISLWEIAMLMKKQKIRIEATYLEFIEIVIASNKYVFRGLTPDIADMSVNLPPEVNNDPADRIIAATAVVYDLPLVTADRNLRQAEYVVTVW